MIIWMANIALSAALLVVTAATATMVPAYATVHLLVSGLVTTTMALIALREAREMSAGGEPRSLILAHLTRHMGLLWAWAALILAITYGTGIMTWRDWVPVFVVFMLFSGLTLFLSRILRDDQTAGRDDQPMSRLAGVLAVATLFAVVLVAGSIGFSRLAGYETAHSGVWVAQHVMVFAGIAIAVVAAFLLKATAAALPSAPADGSSQTGQTA